eukprot:scaffold3581_cov99-Isochrysis_galbana.AAC.2
MACEASPCWHGAYPPCMCARAIEDVTPSLSAPPPLPASPPCEGAQLGACSEREKGWLGGEGKEWGDFSFRKLGACTEREKGKGRVKGGNWTEERNGQGVTAAWRTAARLKENPSPPDRPTSPPRKGETSVSVPAACSGCIYCRRRLFGSRSTPGGVPSGYSLIRTGSIPESSDPATLYSRARPPTTEWSVSSILRWRYFPKRDELSSCPGRDLRPRPPCSPARLDSRGVVYSPRSFRRRIHQRRRATGSGSAPPGERRPARPRRTHAGPERRGIRRGTEPWKKSRTDGVLAEAGASGVEQGGVVEHLKVAVVAHVGVGGGGGQHFRWPVRAAAQLRLDHHLRRGDGVGWSGLGARGALELACEKGCSGAVGSGAGGPEARRLACRCGRAAGRSTLPGSAAGGHKRDAAPACRRLRRPCPRRTHPSRLHRRRAPTHGRGRASAGVAAP